MSAPMSAHPLARSRADAGPGESGLWSLDASELAGLIRAGAVSSREAVEACLQRMDRVNGMLNAVVRRFDAQALGDAARADASLRGGEPVGPLHGVPVTVKVNIDQQGHPTDGGIVAYRDLIATSDNPVVANLRRAGAVVIGRTNTPGYSMRWHTDNDLHGPTLNPWNRDVTPGGSSGGAAAAVAAGLGPIAHGNDIAGSVRYPAYCCGVFGLRPSHGRIPSSNGTATGLAPISSQLMAVQGPLTRSMRDMRLAFAAMAQPSPLDTRCVVPAPFPPPWRPLRVALVAGSEEAAIAPEVAAAVREAGRRLAAGGYVVEEVMPPRIDAIARIWARMAMPDVMAGLQPLIDRNGDDGIKRAVALWNDVLPAYGPQDVLVALGERSAALRDWQVFLETYPVVVMPVSYDLPFRVGFDIKDGPSTARVLEAQGPMMAISVMGLPGLSVPVGLAGGVPTGVQVVAGRFREDLIFDAAELIEAHGIPRTPLSPAWSPA